MTDYYLQVSGEYGTSLGWSFGQHYTSASSESSIATAWHSAWSNAWTAGPYGLQVIYPTTTSVLAVSVATLNGTMHEVSKTRLALADAGISADDTLPYQNSVVISWRGIAIQRYGRGRWFMPAPVETTINANVLTSGAASRYKDAIGSVYTAMTTDGSTFFVTNKKALKDGTPPFRKTIVTTPLVAMKPARQSRRVRKVPTSYT